MIYRAVLAFLLTKLGVLAFNLKTFPVLDTRRHGRAAGEKQPSVSVLVPVRDEADTLPTTLAALAAQPAAELIVLDDGSTDGSFELATELLSAHPHAQVVRGRPAPPGWVGKTWAVHQLSELAEGELLLFCDADVQLADGAVPAVLTEMARQQADVFSVFPRQVTGSLGEQLLTPLIDDVLLCLLPFALLSMDIPSAATANGSVLVFTRAAYRQLGGFAAVRGELVEDVAMARRTRRAGLKLGLALGGRVVSTRMYDGYRELVPGFARGLLPVVGSRTGLVAGLLWHLLAYTAPLPLSFRRRRWIVLLSLGIIERALVEAKTRRPGLLPALLVPFSPIAAVPVVARALHRRQTWKGRVYA